jgi:hypothetical protein
MTDFLMFIGPWKTLFYGLALGFVIGSIFTIWVSEAERTTND